MIATGIVAITLIGIVVISIGRFSGTNPVGPGILLDGVTAIEKNFNQGFTFLQGNFKDLTNYKKNSNEIAKLEKENNSLKQEVIDLNNRLNESESLTSLKKVLNFVDEKYKAKSISTSIVGKNDGNWYSSFTIGAGSNDGVKKESIVVNGNGLVGMVYEVSKDYSKAISLLDTKSSVSFKLMKNLTSKAL